MVYTLPPSPKLLPPHARCPQKLFCNNPHPPLPSRRHLHVAPHAFVIFLTPSLPPTSSPTQLITVPWPKLKVELTWTYIEGVIHKSPNWRFRSIQSVMGRCYFTGPQPRWRVRSKKLFSPSGQMFSPLLQAMAKNNNVPSIDVGFAIICLFTKKLGNF